MAIMPTTSDFLSSLRRAAALGRDVIIVDVRLTHVQIVSATYLPDLFKKHAPGCVSDFMGAKQDPMTFGYVLRFLVDVDCLIARVFPHDDAVGVDFVIEDEDLEVV